MNKKTALSLILLVLVLVLIGWLGYGYYQKQTYNLERPLVTMEIEGYGTVKIELYPDAAPNTVANFIKLINQGYYEGSTFYRVEDSLIQGGKPEEIAKQSDLGLAEEFITNSETGEQTENPENLPYSIVGEFETNEFEDNTLSFERGTLGLARADYSMYYYYTGDDSYLKLGYDSGSTEFFIMAEDNKDFDGYYCAFGKVVEGMEIVDKIKELETVVETTTDSETGEETTNETTTPVEEPVITKMTVETYGTDYGTPSIILQENN